MTITVDLKCAKPGCERPWMRQREGERFCLFHPDQEPPTPEDVARANDAYYKAKTRAKDWARKQRDQALRDVLELQHIWDQSQAELQPHLCDEPLVDDGPEPAPADRPKLVTRLLRRWPQ